MKFVTLKLIIFKLCHTKNTTPMCSKVTTKFMLKKPPFLKRYEEVEKAPDQ